MFQADVSVGRFSNGKIKIEPDQVQGVNGRPYALLVFPIELSFSKIDHVPIYQEGNVLRFSVISMQAILTVEPSYRIADSIAIFDPLDFTNERNASRQYSLEFPLDPARIGYLEASRRGNLVVNIRFQLLVSLYDPLLVNNGTTSETKHFVADYRRVAQQPEIRVEISQSHWVTRVLPALGVGEYFLIEIPKGKKTVTDAWKYLDKADAGFRNWNSKEVYGNCRELGTLLDQTMKDKFGADNFAYKIRWKRAYDGYNNLASWSLHLEDLKKSPSYSPELIETNKSDAEHLLLRTKALLKYAEEMLSQ
jgi:hypothetical protein